MEMGLGSTVIPVFQSELWLQPDTTQGAGSPSSGPCFFSLLGREEDILAQRLNGAATRPMPNAAMQTSLLPAFPSPSSLPMQGSASPESQGVPRR